MGDLHTRLFGALARREWETRPAKHLRDSGGRIIYCDHLVVDRTHSDTSGCTEVTRHWVDSVRLALTSEKRWYDNDVRYAI